MRLGTADVLVRAKTGKYKRDLKSAKNATQKFGREVRASLNENAKSFVLFATVAGAAFTALGLKALGFGSDLEETQGKFDVVFRGMTETAEEWAKNLQDNYAQSEIESKKYLSSLQDLIVPTGIAREEAGRLSNEFVKMASDLGSFNNLPTQKVIEDIQSALAGGSETLTKYGINVKVAAVKQEALNQGWIKGTEKITQAQRQQAILNIMMREGADAVGDMARTSESYANQLKDTSANVEDTATKIGQSLIPAATTALRVFNDWFDLNEELINQQIPEYIADIGEAFVFLIDAGDGVLRVFEIVGKSLTLTALQIEHGLLLLADGLTSGPILALNNMIELINKIPGVPTIPMIESTNIIREELRLVQGAVVAAEADINSLFTTDLAGTALQKSFRQAQEDAKKISEQSISANSSADNSKSGGASGGKHIFSEEIQAYAELKDFQHKTLNDMWLFKAQGMEESSEEVVSLVEQEYAQIQELTNQLGQGVDNAFGGALKGVVQSFSDESKNLSDIASDLLGNLADSLLDYALSVAKAQLIASSGGSEGSSLTGSLIKGIIGGLTSSGGGGSLGAAGVSAGGVAHFADGGSMGSDGRRKPFPAVIHNDEVVGTPSQMQEQFGGVGQGAPGQTIYNIKIEAIDSKSFVELTRSTPEAIIAPLIDQANRGNSGLKSAIQKAAK
jgi:hypothetical protein